MIPPFGTGSIMADHLTKKHRSWNMSRIRSKHSKPEVIIRSLLHRAGYRFRLNNKKLPGCPDIVLSKYKTVIFVNGCFWHRHENCSRSTTPNTNKEYWIPKFNKNILRDIKVKNDLEKLGWSVFIVWECEVIKDPIVVFDRILRKNNMEKTNCYSLDINRMEILKIAENRSDYLIKKETMRREE
jgi:DNA mismatch endonuclease (patch repair protein)